MPLSRLVDVYAPRTVVMGHCVRGIHMAITLLWGSYLFAFKLAKVGGVAVFLLRFVNEGV